ncbi:MAG: fatty acid desaturase [Bacteroidota bacterium]
MSITSHSPVVREVINQVVNDPDYKKVSYVPLLSIPQVALIVFSYLCVFGSLYLHLSYGMSLWIAYPIMVFGFYTSFTPLHDATHRAVSSNKLLNDLLGTISGNLLFPLSNAAGYRYLHLAHHRYVGDKDLDPDEGMVGIPTKYFPFGYIVLLFTDLLWVYWLFFKAWKRTPVKTRINVLSMIFGNIFFHLAWFLSPYWFEYMLWFYLPNRLAIGYTSWAFAHTPHPEGMHWHDFPFQSTYNLTSNKLYLKSFWGQDFHAMHHFLPHIPWFKYHKVWHLANGVFSTKHIPVKEILSRPDAGFKERLFRKGITQEEKNLQVRVSSITEVAKGVKSFVLEAAELPPFSAGSHVNVHLPSGKKRSYSLLNPPFDKNRYQIAVKYEPKGKGGSQEMHEQITEGDVLTLSPPRNNFLLYENVQKYLLISGGIGITPLLSMAHRLTEIDKHFEFHICAKQVEEIPFQYELTNWSFAPNVEIHLDKGGKSSLDAASILAAPDSHTLLYVCGPAGFNRWIKDTALGTGWNPEQIKIEAFVADTASLHPPKEFELILNKSGKSLTVPEDATIIDSLLYHNIKVDYSCLQGTCGTCIHKVLEGDIDHRDAVLSEEEKIESTKMCLCVSRCTGDKLVIDL